MGTIGSAKRPKTSTHQCLSPKAGVKFGLANIPDAEERVLVATGRYLGEGFDDARLDTLFLTLPISWRGTVAQYVGRLHRLHAAKCEVLIYDYVDANEPVLAKMAAKREAGYRSLGYQTVDGAELGLTLPPSREGPRLLLPRHRQTVAPLRRSLVGIGDHRNKGLNIAGKSRFATRSRRDTHLSPTSRPMNPLPTTSG